MRTLLKGRTSEEKIGMQRDQDMQSTERVKVLGANVSTKQ